MPVLACCCTAAAYLSEEVLDVGLGEMVKELLGSMMDEIFGLNVE